MPALLAQLAHGEVLDDPVLDVLEPGVVGVEHLARVARGRAAPRSASPTARRGASRGRCGSSTPRASCRPAARAGRARARPARGRRRAARPPSILRRYSSTTEASSSPSSLRIDSIWRRRMYSRCCFAAPSSTSSRMRRRTCISASRSRWSCERQLEPLDDVERLEQLDLLLEGEVGRVAGRVGERAGLGDRADEGRDAAVVAAQLEDLLDDGAVLALELARAGVGLVVGALLDLDAQAALRVGLGGAGDAAVQAVRARRRGRRPAAGRGRSPRRPCRRSRSRPRGAGRAARAPRPDVDGQGHVHVREDDDVLQRDEQQRAQHITPSLPVSYQH